MASAEAGASLETLSAVLHPGNAIAAPALAMPQLREIAIDSFIQSFFFARRTRPDVPFEGGHARQSLSLSASSFGISAILRAKISNLSNGLASGSNPGTFCIARGRI